MATRIGINGFGRIGRQVLRSALERHTDTIDIAAVNDLADAKTNAYLFKYDSTYGRYPGTVEAAGNTIVVNGKELAVFAERNPASIPWGKMGIDIVIESTGQFTKADQASAHLEGGAKKVIISAPAKGEDLTVVLGVNQHLYDPKVHNVISNASCTTNCMAPLVKVLHKNFTIKKGVITTVHAYTNDQKILDQVHKDLRRSRAAAQNIIPTSTGSAEAVGLVIPELRGLLHGIAMRVPVATGSVTDFVGLLGDDVTADEINVSFQKAAEKELAGIMEYTSDPIVSSDVIMNPASCIIDSQATVVIERNLVKVLGWYDNEWGYACRTADLAAFIADKGI